MRKSRWIVIGAVLMAGISTAAFAQLSAVPPGAPALQVPAALAGPFQAALNAHRAGLQAELNLLMSARRLLLGVKAYLPRSTERERQGIAEALRVLDGRSHEPSMDTEVPGEPIQTKEGSHEGEFTLGPGALDRRIQFLAMGIERLQQKLAEIPQVVDPVSSEDDWEAPVAAPE